jgi:hypothetical protein
LAKKKLDEKKIGPKKKLGRRKIIGPKKIGPKKILADTLAATPTHTVAIWTFTFHKISGFVSVILKANFKQAYKPGL